MPSMSKRGEDNVKRIKEMQSKAIAQAVQKAQARVSAVKQTAGRVQPKTARRF